MDVGSFQGIGGLKVFTRSWRPATGAPRGALVVVHGFNSHSGYYEWAAKQFVAHGLSVHALDLQGRGRSEGERFYIGRFDDYVANVTTLVTEVQSREPEIPIFLLGHSAGGVVCCLYALEHQAELAGLICESFAHELPAPDVALAILKGLGHVAPHAHVLKLKNEDFSRDPKVVEAMNHDPLIANETQPIQTVAALVRADERLKKEFSRITLPLLILHGRSDKAAKATGSQHFHEMAGSTDKTLLLYEGYFHDLLNDLGRENVVADVQRWIDARILVSGHAAGVQA
jgi:alpha-beta hydrolase superfamily lysophospholipase